MNYTSSRLTRTKRLRIAFEATLIFASGFIAFDERSAEHPVVAYFSRMLSVGNLLLIALTTAVAYLALTFTTRNRK